MGNCLANKKSNTRFHQMETLKNVTLDTCNDVTYDFTYAKVVDVYDGDTITIAAWYDGLIRKFKVRIFGIDCAEMKSHKNESIDDRKERFRLANEAKDYVIEKTLGQIVCIDVLNNKYINKLMLHERWKNYFKNGDAFNKNIRDGKQFKEKWGRLLADVYVDGKLLSHQLLDKGLAKLYFGGTKG